MSGRNRLLVYLLAVFMIFFFLATFMYYKEQRFGFPVAARRERLVVVSGINSNHFEEAKDLIGSVQRFLPTTRIVVYDLGLKAKQRKELETLCKVDVRTFDFEQYPPHFRELRKYAWKATIIRSLAHEFEYVFWGDASIRLVDNFESALAKLDTEFPLKGHHHPFKIVQSTHSGTLDYLNVTREMMQGIIGIASGLLLFKTNKLAKDFLDLWYDCSMHEACIAPKGAKLLPCNFTLVKPESLEYIGCHRFDQSVLNVLLRREFGREVFAEILDSVVDHLQVIRRPSRLYELKTCS